MPGLSCQIPKSCVAGDTVTFTVSSQDYPAPDWTLSFSLSGAITATFSSVANGSDHLVTIEAGEKNSRRFQPGRYTATLIFSNGTERKSVRAGSVFVYPDPTRQRDKLPCEIALEKIEKTIIQLTTLLNTQTGIAQQSSTKQSLDSALTTRERLQAQVNFERRKLGEMSGGGMKTIVTRFCA